MNKLTQKALEESIAHWKRMKADPYGGKEEPYGADCALCERFFNDGMCELPERLGGERCPVYVATGRRGCKGSPWLEAADMWSESRWWPSQGERLPVGWADAEIAFLERLRPATADEPAATATGARTGTVQGKVG